ncbi:MAG TPA: hypothetical protein P5287_02465 [bacterium]|nr:hypothetical protein [bacterium]
MASSTTDKKIYRIIDVNINRLREALRVIEEVVRFILDDAAGSRAVKTIRHRFDATVRSLAVGIEEIEAARDARGDVGRAHNIPSEMSKKSYRDILNANLHRAEESLRVLEEFLKLYDGGASARCKELRFLTYELEASLCRRGAKGNR